VPSKERIEAIAIANRLLDEPFADPDDDLRVLARQFLRAMERATYAELQPAPEPPAEWPRCTWCGDRLERVSPGRYECIKDGCYDRAAQSPPADGRKEPEWTTEAFVGGARWARMAAEKAFDDSLLNEDAAYFASTGGRIRCRGDGTLQHFLRTTKPPPVARCICGQGSYASTDQCPVCSVSGDGQ
jgi:hypothetical protein